MNSIKTRMHWRIVCIVYIHSVLFNWMESECFILKNFLILSPFMFYCLCSIELWNELFISRRLKIIISPFDGQASESFCLRNIEFLLEFESRLRTCLAGWTLSAGGWTFTGLAVTPSLMTFLSLFSKLMRSFGCQGRLLPVLLQFLSFFPAHLRVSALWACFSFLWFIPRPWNLLNEHPSSALILSPMLQAIMRSCWFSL